MGLFYNQNNLVIFLWPSKTKSLVVSPSPIVTSAVRVLYQTFLANIPLHIPAGIPSIEKFPFASVRQSKDDLPTKFSSKDVHRI